MVFKLPSLQENQLFITSDQQQQERAGGEIAAWVGDHGYSLTKSDCTYAIFKNGQLVREWSLVERENDQKAA